MAKYEVRDVVCDYGVYEDGELKLILDSKRIALQIVHLLEEDERIHRELNPTERSDAEMTGYNCKECIHFQICDYSGRQLWGAMAGEEGCSDFKDKSRIVELPCKVGDKVYKLTRNKVKECEVVFVGISADEKCSHFNFVENYEDGTFYKSYSMVFGVIGKTVFLTRKKAEEALRKEREK